MARPAKGRSGRGDLCPGSQRGISARYAATYDRKRGEPFRGYPKGTAFEDLPENYVCPICGLDPKITSFYGPVGKSQFEPILDI
ncbi:MAG: rubredoxin [Methanoculleus sp.]